jgi:hypothetical protein
MIIELHHEGLLVGSTRPTKQQIEQHRAVTPSRQSNLLCESDRCLLEYTNL